MSRRNHRVETPTTRATGEAGPPCPRCGRATEVREHIAITERMLAQPFYYERWYICRNSLCRTTTIMPEEFIVEAVVALPLAGELRPGDDVVMDVLNEVPKYAVLDAGWYGWGDDATPRGPLPWED